MEIKQRRLFTATKFQFQSDYLVYELKNLAGSKQITVDYADMSPDVKAVEERHASYLYFGLVLFGVGLILGAYIYETENRWSGINWAVMGLILLIAYFVETKKLSIVHTSREFLVVLCGGDHDRILLELHERRKRRFLQVLARPDFQNDESKRASLIGTLRDQRIFSEEEANALLDGDTAKRATGFAEVKLH